MSFLETPRFPDDIAYGSKGGPSYNTTVIKVDSGYEKRNINWAYPMHRFDVAYGVRDQEDLYVVINMFHAVAGRGHGFRFKDWADFRSCEDQTNLGAVSDTDQVIGTGNGSATVFQLKKTYNTGVLERERIITKPIASTVVVSVDSSAIVSGWAVASATGVVTFDSAVASAAVVRAGFEFDVPCRFDTDELDVQWEHYELQTAQIPVSEIRT